MELRSRPGVDAGGAIACWQADSRQGSNPSGLQRASWGHEGDEMDDRELIRMALFRVAETAKRVARLAASARESGVREHLSEVAARLSEHEQQLSDLV
jgi:hypothetical protein